MNLRDFAKLIEGLENAAALAQGVASNAKKTHVVPVVDVRETRRALNLTRHQFAERFFLSARTIQNWEQVLSKPDDAARLYLQLVRHNPVMVQEALAQVFSAAADRGQSGISMHVVGRARPRAKTAWGASPVCGRDQASKRAAKRVHAWEFLGSCVGRA
jgi:putative transcriptional regulator